uniref:Alpha-galactosidase n=1 Tax=Tetraselmis sp. GSL018 TaxID=582737 RepID=A0A061RD77_9CHLO|mmetsp:Transcript_23869/g.56878  ORF Transcript_23869/g.56878 Transcript_23869/m.56878 type:complete len:436 (+) Transcript_23869:256-1563(+)
MKYLCSYSVSLAFVLLFPIEFAFDLVGAEGLSNGLSRTPPMGWLAWERFRCNVNCEDDPKNCVQESLFMDMADRMIEDGFLEAGYDTVIIDDCWMAKSRGPGGEMVSDPDRFPSGIKHLADYMHRRSLKLGLYSDIGTKTCEAYPGMAGHLRQDANTFANWDIDYLKVDGCFARFSSLPALYTELGHYLNETGKRIVYSCSWPAYYHFLSPARRAAMPDYKVPYRAMRDAGCNLWRNWYDIESKWASIRAIILYWWKESHENPEFTSIAGPGVWNDPDMLVIGNPGISEDNARAQMAMWAVFAAPLLMSNDLRDLPASARNILLNREVIAVNQDKAGRQGTPIPCSAAQCRKYQVWQRSLADGSLAVALLNLSDMTAKICARWEDLGLAKNTTCFVRDLFAKQYRGVEASEICAVVRGQSAELYKLSLEHRFDIV